MTSKQGPAETVVERVRNVILPVLTQQPWDRDRVNDDESHYTPLRDRSTGLRG